MGLILAVTTPVARKGLTFTCPRRSLSGSPGGRALEAGFFVFAFGVFFMCQGVEEVSSLRAVNIPYLVRPGLDCEYNKAVADLHSEKTWSSVIQTFSRCPHLLLQSPKDQPVLDAAETQSPECVTAQDVPCELLLPTPAEEDAWKPLSSQPFGETTVALQNSSSRVAALVCAQKALPGGNPTKVKTDVQKLPSQQEGARILLSDAPAAPLGASVSPPLWKWLLGPPLTLLENQVAAFRSQPFGLVPRAQLPQTSPGSLAKDSSPQRQSPSGQESPKCVTTGDRCGAEMNDISGLLSHWSASHSTCRAVVEFPGAVAAGRRVAGESLPSIEELARQMEDEEINLPEKPRTYLKRVFRESIYKPLVERSILDYLRYNHYHLPMYAWPGII
ncbi:hypothetical protein CB1_000139004 [Camelus ferus]|nr:hypothetical protein CB1_000139004 [Camelus ferus]